MNKNYTDDIITAISTAPITSAIGIVRISGNGALNTIKNNFTADIQKIQPRKAVYGHFNGNNDNIIDQVILTFYQAPNSYTGEDVVEISCHGSPFIMNSIMRCVIENGGRTAQNGEFTKRAYLNGKIDLTQVEAVIDMIESESQFEIDNANFHLSGRYSHEIEQIRKNLLDNISQILAYIDFPDDEIADVSQQTLSSDIEKSLNSIETLYHSYKFGKFMKDGIKTAIIGKPNAGKSMLMNCLLGYDRSIVTSQAGTTRDVVRESVSFNGMKIVLSDTAGLRQTSDLIENLGIDKTIETLNNSDLILTVFDGSEELSQDDINLMEIVEKINAKKVAIINKNDLVLKLNAKKIKNYDNIVYISAKDNIGIDNLEAVISGLFNEMKTLKNSPVIMNLRQYECIVKVREILKRAKENIGFTPDIIITDMEDAVAILGEITGKTVSDEIMENIFSRFCVGK